MRSSALCMRRGGRLMSASGIVAQTRFGLSCGPLQSPSEIGHSQIESSAVHRARISARAASKGASSCARSVSPTAKSGCCSPFASDAEASRQRVVIASIADRGVLAPEQVTKSVGQSPQFTHQPTQPGDFALSTAQRDTCGKPATPERREAGRVELLDDSSTG
jgi:hypothetical protein